MYIYGQNIPGSEQVRSKLVCKFYGSIRPQKNITIRERPLSKKALDSSDVFILDLGREVFQVRDHLSEPQTDTKSPTGCYTNCF